jgi:hypothetical protein
MIKLIKFYPEDGDKTISYILWVIDEKGILKYFHHVGVNAANKWILENTPLSAVVEPRDRYKTIKTYNNMEEFRADFFEDFL